MDFLEPTEEERFFVFDCHRPYHINNVSDTERVFLFGVETLDMIPQPPEDEEADQGDADDDDDDDDTDGDEEFAADLFDDDTNDENMSLNGRVPKSVVGFSSSSSGSLSDDGYISGSYDSQSEGGAGFDTNDDDNDDSELGELGRVGRKRHRRGFADEEASEDDQECEDGDSDISQSEDDASIRSKGGDDSLISDDESAASSSSSFSERRKKTRVSVTKRGQKDRERKRQKRYTDTQMSGSSKKTTSSVVDAEIYYSSTFYARSSSMTLYDLTKELGRSTKNLLWLSIVGFSDQVLHQRIDAERMKSELACLEQEAQLLFRSLAASSSSSRSMYSAELRVQSTVDFRFMVLRHWNLYDSMYHSSYVASRLGIWSTGRGRNRLELFLAKMGLPLRLCKEEFSLTDSHFRKTLGSSLREFGPRFGLDDLCFKSFVKV